MNKNIPECESDLHNKNTKSDSQNSSCSECEISDIDELIFPDDELPYISQR